jgi:hypothetical protein
MKIRHDSVFVSSVLFTVALLLLVPWCWNEASASGFSAHFRPGPNGVLQQMSQILGRGRGRWASSELFRLRS